MNEKNKKYLIGVIILCVIVFIVGYKIYQNKLEEQWDTADADYSLKCDANADGDFDIDLIRERHSGNFKSIDFAITIPETNYVNLNDTNYKDVEYSFEDTSTLIVEDSDNDFANLKLEYHIDKQLLEERIYGFFHLVVNGNNDKEQYFTIVYYLNGDDVMTQVLEADDVYNHSLIEVLANKISNYNNIDLDLNTLSNLLVKERESLKLS